MAEVDGLTNSINCLHSLGSPNGASEPNKHRSGTSVRAVLTDRGVNAADKSRYAFAVQLGLMLLQLPNLLIQRLAMLYQHFHTF